MTTEPYSGSVGPRGDLGSGSCPLNLSVYGFPGAALSW